MKVAQSCLTLCDPMDYTVHGILQARILEWVACPFSRGSSQPRDWTQVSCIVGELFNSWATREALILLNYRHTPICRDHFSSSVQSLSCVQLFTTPLTTARQASLSITNSWSLPKLISIESVMPSNHLTSVVPFSSHISLSQHQGLFKWVSSSHQVAKVLEFQLQHQSFQWTLRTDFLWDGWLDLLAVQGTLTVQKHQFFGTQLSL